MVPTDPQNQKQTEDHDTLRLIRSGHADHDEHEHSPLLNARWISTMTTQHLCVMAINTLVLILTTASLIEHVAVRCAYACLDMEAMRVCVAACMFCTGERSVIAHPCWSLWLSVVAGNTQVFLLCVVACVAPRRMFFVSVFTFSMCQTILTTSVAMTTAFGQVQRS